VGQGSCPKKSQRAAGHTMRVDQLRMRYKRLTINWL
jgi:hypothetical protein